MPLNQEELAALLAKPASKRGGGGRKKAPQGSVRDVDTWFKLPHILIDPTMPVGSANLPKCENPECIDPRPKERGQVVADVNAKLMCRYCFLDGWNTAQQQISQMTINTSNT